MNTDERQGVLSARTTGKPRTDRRTLRRYGKVAGGLAVMLALNGISVTPASAAPNFSIIVSKDDSIVLVDGLAVGAPVTVEVFRNELRIGSVSGNAADLLPADGLSIGAFEINHAATPTVCWQAFTPEILAGDVVVVSSGGATDAVTVADIEVTDGATRLDADTGTVKGRIIATPRPPIDTLSVETRGLGEPRFRSIANGGAPETENGVTTSLAYDDATSGSFTATFDGLGVQQMGVFLDSFEVAATFTSATNAAGDLSATSAVFGAAAGSEDELCPPVARRAVTTLSEGMINIANQGAPLAISGVSVDATAVSATVTDRNGDFRTAPEATLSGAGFTQTWQTSLAAGELAGLADGPLTVEATYTEAGSDLTGATRVIHKDTVAPVAPTISPNGGSFSGSRQVNVNAPDADIRYTLDGSTPGLLNGVRFGGPITLNESATMRAVAIDVFGNVGPVAQAVFTLLTPPVPPAPVPPAPVPPAPPAPVAPAPAAPSAVAKAPDAPKIGKARSGARGGKVTAKAKWAAPTEDGGSDITAYVLTVLRIVNGRVVGRTTITLPGTARSAQVKLRRGKYKFQLRAVNAVGESSRSARSNRVRAR